MTTRQASNLLLRAQRHRGDNPERRGLPSLGRAAGVGDGEHRQQGEVVHEQTAPAHEQTAPVYEPPERERRWGTVCLGPGHPRHPRGCQARYVRQRPKK